MPYTGPYLSTPCADPTCRHPYNWHVPGGVCQSPICQCIAYAQPTKETPMPENTPRSSRAHIASPQANHIAQILREDRLAKETPVPTTPQRAAVYVRHDRPELTSDDLSRLFRLRAYTKECGYTVDAVITAHDPDGAEHPPVAYQLIRRALLDEDLDVIVLWHRDLDVPDTLTRADIAPPASPCKHTWVTALDGDDQPALGADGKPWEHCGLCGLRRHLATPVIPQTLSPLTVGGNQPKYPVGSRFPSRPGTATVASDMCPRCKGDNSEAWALCARCAEQQPATQAPDTITRTDLVPDIPQPTPGTPVDGSTPVHPVGSRVLYDDSPGIVLARRYNGGRDSWDCRVAFDHEGTDGEWVWESDLTPADTDGE